MSVSNGNSTTFNPILGLCTGSHNNASLLESLQQAKGAVLYLCPYLGKLKFPLQHALMILNETVTYVEKFPSKADDSGSDKRTVQHILQRTLNKMMLLMELSDFQVAADLIDLPCIIRSEQYSYLDANASMALQTLVHFHEKTGEKFDILLQRLNNKIPISTEENYQEDFEHSKETEKENEIFIDTEEDVSPLQGKIEMKLVFRKKSRMIFSL